MTTLNLLNSVTINGKTAVLAVPATATSIVSNGAGSSQSYKVNALYISNVNGSVAATIDIDLYRSSTAYRLAKSVSIPAGSTLDFISKTVYLEEGDSLRLTASNANYLEAVCSYEILS